MISSNELVLASKAQADSLLIEIDPLKPGENEKLLKLLYASNKSVQLFRNDTIYTIKFNKKEYSIRLKQPVLVKVKPLQKPSSQYSVIASKIGQGAYAGVFRLEQSETSPDNVPRVVKVMSSKLPDNIRDKKKSANQVNSTNNQLKESNLIDKKVGENEATRSLGIITFKNKVLHEYNLAFKAGQLNPEMPIFVYTDDGECTAYLEMNEVPGVMVCNMIATQHQARETGNYLPSLVQMFPLFISLLQAVQHLIEKEIVHRDLSSANIIADKENVAIIDFGKAITREQAKQPFNKLTTSRRYAAPNTLVTGDRHYSHGTDVWSVIVMIAELAGFPLTKEIAKCDRDNFTKKTDCVAKEITNDDKVVEDARVDDVNSLSPSDSLSSWEVINSKNSQPTLTFSTSDKSSWTPFFHKFNSNLPKQNFYHKLNLTGLAKEQQALFVQQLKSSLVCKPEASPAEVNNEIQQFIGTLNEIKHTQSTFPPFFYDNMMIDLMKELNNPAENKFESTRIFCKKYNAQSYAEHFELMGPHKALTKEIFLAILKTVNAYTKKSIDENKPFSQIFLNARPYFYQLLCLVRDNTEPQMLWQKVSAYLEEKDIKNSIFETTFPRELNDKLNNILNQFDQSTGLKKEKSSCLVM